MGETGWQHNPSGPPEEELPEAEFSPVEIGDLFLNERKDADGDLEYRVSGDEPTRRWMGEKEAYELIEHLRYVFECEGGG